MDATARKAMYRNMVTSLLVHESIQTTEARAKEIRRYVERVITLGKKSKVTGDAGDGAARSVHLRRRARIWVHDDEALGKVFGEYADRYATRDGGYTRVVKTGRRAGDCAAMAIIALVGEGEESNDILGAKASAGAEE
jgi:large subunit ribosomal protein L17